MVVGDRDDQLLPEQRRCLECLVTQRHDHERDVERALLELRDEIARSGFVNDEVNAGERRVELRQSRRKERDGERRCRADREPSAPQVGELADLSGGTVDVDEDATRPGQEDLARRSQRDVALHAVEEGSPELLFENADCARHRRLRHAQAARGFGEVPLLGYGHEVAELVELHAS